MFGEASSLRPAHARQHGCLSPPAEVQVTMLSTWTTFLPGGEGREAQKNGQRLLTEAATGARRSRKTWKRHDSRTKLITVIRFRIIPGWRRRLHLGDQRAAQLATSAARAKTDDF